MSIKSEKGQNALEWQSLRSISKPKQSEVKSPTHADEAASMHHTSVEFYQAKRVAALHKRLNAAGASRDKGVWEVYS